MKNFLRVLGLVTLCFCVSKVTNAQCDINLGCAADPVLTIDPPVFDASTSSIILDNIEFGGYYCDSLSAFTSGIVVYIYQLLPDGTRMEKCDVFGDAPFNVVGNIGLGFGASSFCLTSFNIGLLVAGPDSGFEPCDGAYLEIEAVLYVTDNLSFDADNTSVYTELQESEYYVVNLGNLEININNEFPGQGQPITTAKIRDFNTDAEGSVNLECGQDIDLYLEGLSRIANCAPYDDISTGLPSELTNEFSYSINGEEPIIVLDPANGASGGQLSGPNPELGDLCYAGVLANPFTLNFSELPADLCDGSNIVFTLKTTDLFTNVTAEDEFTVIYSGGTGCSAAEPPGGCDDGDCTNGLEIWDNCECVAGTAPVDPGCDDGECSNGLETWDGCECVTGTAPVDPGCDDGECSNGVEIWDGCECVAGTAPVDPGCDDSDCSNGIETWDGCDCVAGTAPVDLGCDDGECSNGVETWDGCECVAGTAPVDPGCDDGDCSNGVETWDGCECIAGTPGEIPTCDDGNCANGIETYNEATCSCDPGTPPIDPGCDDEDCTNGVETWDGCECVAGTPSVDPGCDDGVCLNGEETWDGCQCVDGEPPVVPTCDDGDCSNGFETWDDTVCECIPGMDIVEPADGCDDEDCANGLETWDAAICECVAGTPPVEPADGCDDGECSNGVETWNGCECVAGTPGETPDCDDGNCANGLETYNETTCSCDPGTPPDDTCPPDESCDTVTGWDSTICMCVTAIIDRAPCIDDDECTLDLFDETTCECVFEPIENCGIVFGCTNPCATNYNPDANEEDDSCMLPDPDDGCDLTVDMIDEVTCEIVNTPNCPEETTFNPTECSCDNTNCAPPSPGVIDCE